jgi:signal transduction histidine kinase
MGYVEPDVDPEDLERLREEIDRLVARRTMFLSASAHELKTPLTVLQVYLETLLGDLSEGLDDEQMEFLQICHESMLKLRNLVIDLVDLAALERGELRFTVERVEVVPVLYAVRDEMEPLARHAEVEIEVESPDHLPAARGDTDRVEQVVRNLVDNAVKNTPPGGAVTVRGRHVEDRVELIVEDNGIGIPEEQLESIFNEYVKGAGDNERNSNGSGLGLAVCRRIVDNLEGEITVESIEGKGSTFTVKLPMWTGR